DLRLKLPGPDDTIKDSPKGKIEIGLLDFGKSSDSFKVKIRERTLAENEVSLLMEIESRVISPSHETFRLVDHTIMDELQNATRKRKRKVAFNVERSAGCWVHATTAALKDFVSSSVTPTLEHEYKDESGANVRNRPASNRYVVFTSSSEPVNTNASASLETASPIPYVKTEAEAAAAGPIHETGDSSAPGHEGRTSSSALGDSVETVKGGMNTFFLKNLRSKIISLSAGGTINIKGRLVH
ncbi:hypothetical protein Tco_0458864, partial [Tanacetum coccineum]